MAYTTINKSTEHFNTVLNTATGTQSVTGVGFQPDFLWLQTRSTGANPHLMDAVRGSSKIIKSSTNDAESTNATFITSFDSDGFSLGGANWSDNRTVANWCWKANGAGSSNTDGTITSTVSANQTAGFSIVSWSPTTTSTPQTIGHGLGVAPSMMIVRNRDVAGDWRVYHSSLGATKALNLNGTNSQINDNGFWNDVEPTSSVFTTGNGYSYTTGGSTDNYIAYCFAEKTGYSKFGSYAGNNNADGTFVYTGFSPAFVLVKRYGGGTQNWGILDNKRPGYNLTSKMLNPNTNGAEGTNNGVDLLSNGFKFRSSDGNSNGYSDGYIYMAFGQSLVGSNNVPCTAR
jgi:hypothetical protein